MQGVALAPAGGRHRGAPAHRRAGLRLPARLVARRPARGLRVVPRRRHRAAAAGSRDRRPTRSSSPAARCSLEPRWSPDGSRIAFTSTLYEGRWHVFTARSRRTARAERRRAHHRGPGERAAAVLLQRRRSVLLADLVARRARADRACPTAATSGARATFWRMPARAGRRSRARSATRRRPGRRGPTGAATAGGWSTRPTWAASGTSSG